MPPASFLVVFLFFAWSQDTLAPSFPPVDVPIPNVVPRRTRAAPIFRSSLSPCHFPPPLCCGLWLRLHLPSPVKQPPARGNELLRVSVLRAHILARGESGWF